MHSTALHILVMSAPKDILMTCKIFCIYSISKMFDTLIICRLYTTKHEAMSLLNCCTTLVCFVKTQKYHISNLIEFIKFSSHNTERKGIHNHGVSTCTIHSAGQMLSQLFLRLIFNTIHEFGGKSLLLPSPGSAAV